MGSTTLDHLSSVPARSAPLASPHPSPRVALRFGRSADDDPTITGRRRREPRRVLAPELVELAAQVARSEVEGTQPLPAAGHALVGPVVPAARHRTPTSSPVELVVRGSTGPPRRR